MYQVVRLWMRLWVAMKTSARHSFSTFCLFGHNVASSLLAIAARNLTARLVQHCVDGKAQPSAKNYSPIPSFPISRDSAMSVG